MSSDLDSSLSNSFGTELDEFDLLRGESTERSGQNKRLANADLSATVDAFSNRIKRRKQEQEKAEGEAQRQSLERHRWMLEAMLNVRKALHEVSRIDLGERFSFALVCDDWQGWPRVGIRVCDGLVPEAEYPLLQVSTNDRQAKGAIEIEFGNTEGPLRMSLTNDKELGKVPATLKKCVRDYLDLVGDIVLEAERFNAHDDSDEDLGTRNIKEFEGKKESESNVLISDDLFVDHAESEDFLDKLPQIEDVESLPDILPAFEED
ncbi:MAG: hypothetical protein KDD44_09070 [Bdellovibrionales bacterium]|nr:hypothetical protein [Bdellovibrionales bacterium]